MKLVCMKVFLPCVFLKYFCVCLVSSVNLPSVFPAPLLCFPCAFLYNNIVLRAISFSYNRNSWHTLMYSRERGVVTAAQRLAITREPPSRQPSGRKSSGSHLLNTYVSKYIYICCVQSTCPNAQTALAILLMAAFPRSVHLQCTLCGSAVGVR